MANIGEEGSAPPEALDFERMLAGVRPGWRELLAPAEDRIQEILQTLRAVLDSHHPLYHERRLCDALAPPPGLVFEAFRYFEPEETRVVIVGQDPYPTPGDAMGLSFSVPPGVAIPKSLANVFAALRADGLLRPHTSAAGRPLEVGDLRPWAAQGVLLLNRALTTLVGRKGEHLGVWKPVAETLVRGLADRAAEGGRKIVFMLWGKEAQKLEASVREGERRFRQGTGAAAFHEILTWSHPSSLSDNKRDPEHKFARCGHFARANRLLKEWGRAPIEWDPLAGTLAYTDGSCPRNGKPDAKAAFAVVFLSGPLRGTEIAGGVAPFRYAFRDPNDPLRGFKLTAEKVAPSNNRGEYLAWCWALLSALRGGVRARAEIVSDCNLFIQTFEDWMPRLWIPKGKGARGSANYDLVEIAQALLGRLEAQVLLLAKTHVNSHKKRPPEEAGKVALVHWHGNSRADTLAGQRVQAIEAGEVEPEAIRIQTPVSRIAELQSLWGGGGEDV